MTEYITRKDFLRLAAAATTSTALAGYAGRGATQNADSDAAPNVAGNPSSTLIRGADVSDDGPGPGRAIGYRCLDR